jgi:hypothetical protein
MGILHRDPTPRNKPLDNKEASICTLDNVVCLGQSSLVTIDSTTDKRAAALRLLGWNDTAVVEDASLLLVLESSVESMSLVCEALASQEAVEDYEGQETILYVLSPAWNSGQVDVPSLLREVRANGNDQARLGATIAIGWLHIDA